MNTPVKSAQRAVPVSQQLNKTAGHRESGGWVDWVVTTTTAGTKLLNESEGNDE